MPWIVGIDEAGYGPNLGPLVMTSVACRVPERLAGADLWHVLRPAVRRHTDAEDRRLLIADSKLIYSTSRGLGALETGVLATLLGGNTACTSLSESTPPPLPAPTLSHVIDRLCPAAHADLRGEPWYAGTISLPVEAQPDVFSSAAERFRRACGKRQIAWGLIRCVIVCPSRFNALLDQWGSKGAVLGYGLAGLLADNRDPDGSTEPVHFLVDKHGGRNNYAALIQHALAEGMVVAHEESMERSRYSVLGLKRPIGLTFQPRADAEHFCVALASMVSKYLREILMREFNGFWQTHLPGLKPTAGYPGDAARFFDDIRPVLPRLGIAEETLWRRK
jgi:hypothetical protein